MEPALDVRYKFLCLERTAMFGRRREREREKKKRMVAESSEAAQPAQHMRIHFTQ